MSQVQEIINRHPLRSLADGDILVSQGDGGGDLYVLESGKLIIERDGVKLATLSIPGSVIGEISVLTGSKGSATVTASGTAKVRVIRDAAKVIESEPKLAIRLAAIVASRLEATSSSLVALTREASHQSERNILSRLASALHLGKD